MKIFDRKTHGYLDYLFGILLMASPWLFDYFQGGIESWVPIIMGAGTIVYSLITDYELGFLKLISMRVHLVVDFAAGVFLAISPWLFGFSDQVFLPHLIFGLIAMVVPLVTNPDAGHDHLGKASDPVQKNRYI